MAGVPSPISRLRSPALVPGDDRRERFVRLTSRGRVVLARGYPVWKAAQAAVSEALDAQELDTQIRSLRRLTKTALRAAAHEAHEAHEAHQAHQAGAKQPREGPAVL